MKERPKDVLIGLRREAEELRNAIKSHGGREDGQKAPEWMTTRLKDVQDGIRIIEDSMRRGEDPKRAVLIWKVEEAQRKFKRTRGSGLIPTMGAMIVTGSREAERRLEKALKALEEYDLRKRLQEKGSKRDPVAIRPRRARNKPKPAGPVGVRVGRRKPRR